MADVNDILTLLEQIAPQRLTEDWDNTGLMVGRPGSPVSKVALAMDPTVDAIRKAAECGAQVLLTHHPLIFRPLKQLNLDTFTGAALALAVKADVSVISAHTNLDAAQQGVSYALARKLDLRNLKLLQASSPKNLYKIFLRTTDEFPETLSLHQGVRYIRKIKDQIIYPVPPETNSKSSAVSQIGWEILVDESGRDYIIRQMKNNVDAVGISYDVCHLSEKDGQEGYGYVGQPAETLTFSQVLYLIKEKLKTTSLRYTGDLSIQVHKVAVMGGSGGGFIHKAHANGAQILISGDLGYHQAREAEHLGLGLIDAGHWATERPVLEPLAETLSQAANNNKLDLQFEVLMGDQDPWHMMEE